MTKMILIITNKDDVTTDFIISKLNKLGVRYYRFNTEDLISKVGVNLRFEENVFEIIDYTKDLVINLKEVKSVYYRRPKLPRFECESLSDGEISFLINEVAFVLEGIYKLLIDRFWISPVFSIRAAENKIYQLSLASKLGFTIPPSIITTTKKSAEAFVKQEENDCIIKPIKMGFITDGKNSKIIFTSMLQEEQINSLYRVELCPTYFQRRIEKTADIRITVVGNKVFPALIKSQEFEDTKTDWRKGSSPILKQEITSIPRELEKKCVVLTKKLGLNFGAIDLILDKYNSYNFLEINPNGQWAWIENRLGYNISEEIVKLLIQGKTQE